MNHKCIILKFLLFLFLVNCNSKNHDLKSGEVQEMFRTNYGKIDDQNLNLKFGDLVEFKVNNEKIKAIVLDIKNEEKENWYGLCFLNNNKIFGRRIPSGSEMDCIDLLDFTYLNEKGLTDYRVINNSKINFDKVGSGSNGSAINLNEVLRHYKVGLNKRRQKETPCHMKLGELNPINECYFPLTKIK